MPGHWLVPSVPQAETLRAARWDVPDRLTPELLRHMLQGIRRCGCSMVAPLR